MAGNTRQEIVDSINKLRRRSSASDSLIIDVLEGLLNRTSDLDAYAATHKDTATSTYYFGFENEIGEYYLMKIVGETLTYCKPDTGTYPNIENAWVDRALLTFDMYRNVF